MSDSTQSEIRTRVKDIMISLFIDEWQSESYHQRQPFSKRRHQTIKRQTSTLLDRMSTPAFAWLLAMHYVFFVLNRSYNATIKKMSLNELTGSTRDMSPLLRFHFWEPVLFNTEDTSFPSDIPEKEEVSWELAKMWVMI